MDRIRRGYYEFEFVRIGEPPYKKGDVSMIVKNAEELEKQILKTPENWLWSHNRWKYIRRKDEKLYKESSK